MLKHLIKTLYQRMSNTNISADDMDTDLRHLDTLIAQKHYHDAIIVCSRNLEQNPNSIPFLSKSIFLYEATKLYDKALLSLENLLTVSSSAHHHKKTKLRLLNALNEHQRAFQYLNDMRNEIDTITYTILLSDIYSSKFEFKNALQLLEGLYETHPDNEDVVTKLVCLLKKITTPKNLAQATHIIEKHHNQFRGSPRLQYERLNLYCTLDNIPMVREVERHMSEADNDSIAVHLARSWLFYKDQKFEECKNSYAKVLSRTYHLAIDSPMGHLKRLSAKDIADIRTSKVVAIACMRNEMHILEDWLTYYRSIGINDFLIIDNDSDDGMTEFLSKQVDVVHYHTNESYSQSAFGMRWINQVLHQLSSDTWCLFADADEFLITPSLESRGLIPLLEYMESQGHEALTAFMLDMHTGDQRLTDTSQNTPLSTHRYFTHDYHVFGDISPPYKLVTGGMRQTLFPNTAPLTKTPLVKGGGGISFISSSHTTTPAIFSDVTGCFLHYKFIDGFVERATLETERKEHALGGFTHKIYADKLSSLPKGNLPLENDKSIKYENSKQLIELGLIESSIAFDEFNLYSKGLTDPS